MEPTEFTLSFSTVQAGVRIAERFVARMQRTRCLLGGREYRPGRFLAPVLLASPTGAR